MEILGRWSERTEQEGRIGDRERGMEKRGGDLRKAEGGEGAGG